MTEASTKRRSSKAEALSVLCWDIPATFFRLRAMGQRMGAVTPGGGGAWGVMHSLKLEGPRTVPQLARSRPVARQHIQKLADELAEAGLVEFIDNPDHRRSRRLRLTAKGERTYAELSQRILDAAERWAGEFQLDDLNRTIAVLRRFRDLLRPT
jgi:DNA-binding MarR family transcriptional regulator